MDCAILQYVDEQIQKVEANKKFLLEWFMWKYLRIETRKYWVSVVIREFDLFANAYKICYLAFRQKKIDLNVIHF